VEASDERASTVTGYRLPDEIADWTRQQAAKERRYPANVVADALRQYRGRIEKRQARSRVGSS
jgi:predicted transcriptional regulator